MFYFHPILGEMIPILTSIFFQMGWNHQLLVVYLVYPPWPLPRVGGWFTDSLQGGGPVFDSRGYITGVAFCKAPKRATQHGWWPENLDFFWGGEDSNMAMWDDSVENVHVFFRIFGKSDFFGQTCNPCNPESPPNSLVDRMSAIVRTTLATLGSKGGCVWTLSEIKLRPTPFCPTRNIQHSVVVSNIFIFTAILGEMMQFDQHLSQMG